MCHEVTKSRQVSGLLRAREGPLWVPSCGLHSFVIPGVEITFNHPSLVWLTCSKRNGLSTYQKKQLGVPSAQGCLRFLATNSQGAAIHWPDIPNGDGLDHNRQWLLACGETSHEPNYPNTSKCNNSMKKHHHHTHEGVIKCRTPF